MTASNDSAPVSIGVGSSTLPNTSSVSSSTVAWAIALISHQTPESITQFPAFPSIDLKRPGARGLLGDRELGRRRGSDRGR